MGIPSEFKLVVHDIIPLNLGNHPRMEVPQPLCGRFLWTRYPNHTRPKLQRFKVLGITCNPGS